MNLCIECKEVSFRYEDRLILEAVSFSVDHGEFLGVIGPNGGGKTTLLRLILGFLEPTKGEVLIHGRNPKWERTTLSYVPQATQFDPQFPIRLIDLVLQGRLCRLPWYGRYSQEDRKLAEEALDKVGLLSMKYAPFSSLSGGQKQRAIIARALANQPEVLVLDESTANVDAQAEKAIYELLGELKRSITILMVTHEIESALFLVDRVLCVQKSASFLPKDQVCSHVSLGVYHPPLQDKEKG